MKNLLFDDQPLVPFENKEIELVDNNRSTKIKSKYPKKDYLQFMSDYVGKDPRSLVVFKLKFVSPKYPIAWV